MDRKEVPALAEAALSLDPKVVAETSLIDLTHLILKTTNKTFLFRDLMQEIARIKGLSEEQVNQVIARLYTEINIDGRFVCIGSNVWGLKRWYPTDKLQAEKAAGGKKFVRKDLDDDDDFYGDDEDDYVEEEAEEDDVFAAYDDVDAEEETPAEDFEEEEEEAPELDEEEASDEDAESDELDGYEEEEEDF